MRSQPILKLVRGRWRRAATVIPAPAAMLVLAVGIEVAARRLARAPDSQLDATSLTLAAVRANPALVGLAVAAVAVVALAGRRGIGLAWGDLEHGRQLQLLAGLAAALLAWRYSTTGYDYLFATWHTADRLLLVLVAAAAVARPVALLPLVVLVHVLEAPFLVPFGFFPGQNIDQLLVLVLAVVAAACLYAMITGDARTAPVLTLLVAVVAAHFFVPGRGKLALGWHSGNELANMPLNGYAQGWLGAGDGALARRLADLFDTFGAPLRAATFALELGAPLAVLHRRLAVGWLSGFVVFHVAVGAALGFSFLEWAVIELALIAVLARPANRAWVNTAFRLEAVAVALVAVLLGGWLFDPPRLSWIDGPLVYAYEIDGVDAEGRRWALTAADLEPFDQAFAFSALPLGPLPPLASGYGAIDDRRQDELAALDSLEQLGDLERLHADGRTPTEAERAEVVWVLERFMDATARPRTAADRLPAPPRHFWTDRPGEGYDRRSPIVRIEVTRVTTLRTSDDNLERREPVLVVDHRGGRTVTFPSPAVASAGG